MCSKFCSFIFIFNVNKAEFCSVVESSHPRCSEKRVFLEISQNSQENTCARVSFLIKLQASGRFCSFCFRRQAESSASGLQLLKKATLARVFSGEFCEIYKNTFSTEHLGTTASVVFLLSTLRKFQAMLYFDRRSFFHQFASLSITLKYLLHFYFILISIVAGLVKGSRNFTSFLVTPAFNFRSIRDSPVLGRRGCRCGSTCFKWFNGSHFDDSKNATSCKQSSRSLPSNRSAKSKTIFLFTSFRTFLARTT